MGVDAALPGGQWEVPDDHDREACCDGAQGDRADQRVRDRDEIVEWMCRT